MEQELFTADEVAERLGLHVRTVRNYIRDGQLAAVRIGKRYRITREALEAFTGAPATDPEPVRRHRHVEVSSVVEIDAVGPTTAHRVATLLTAAVNGDQARVRIKTIYHEQRGHLKVVVFGGLADSAHIFGLIEAITEDEGS